MVAACPQRERPASALRVVLAAFALAGLLGSRPVFAGDGAISWRTLSVAGADIHHPAGLEAFARRVAATFADARQTLEPLFDYRPTAPVQITIDDWADEANGWATPYPYDHIHLLPYPPEGAGDLADHGDWVRLLVFHEYAHILHMAQASGLPRWVNAVVGRQWLPNVSLPRFFLEGLAAWAETRHTGRDIGVAGRGGRADSAQFRARWRAAVLDGVVPDLAELTGRPVAWPRGAAWYVWGTLLLDHLGRRHGAAAIAGFVRDYGSRIVPFGVQGTSRAAFGASLSRRWLDAVDELRGQVAVQVDAVCGPGSATAVALEGPPAPDTPLARCRKAHEGQRLTHDGEERGRVRRWPEPTGSLGAVVVAHSPADGRSRIERVDRTSGVVTPLHTCALDCDEPFVTPDRRWLLFSETRRHARVYAFRELVAVELDAAGRAVAGTGDGLALTSALRIRTPELDPTGQFVVAVQVRAARTSIVALHLQRALAAARAGGPPEQPHILIYAPDFSATLDSPAVIGGRLWWTQGAGRERHLWSADVDLARSRASRPHRVVGLGTTTAAGVRVPVPWVGDLHGVAVGAGGAGGAGAALGAIVEVAGTRQAARLALDPATGGPVGEWTLQSQVWTGVRSAAVGATGTVALVYRGRGFDLHALPDAGSDNRFAPPHAVPVAPTPGTATDVGHDAPLYAPEASPGRSAAYSAWSTLRPRQWTPVVSADGTVEGTWLGARTTGRDALDQFALDASSQIRLDGRQATAQLGLRWSRLEPELGLDLGYQPGNAAYRRGWSWGSTPTHRAGARLGIAWIRPGLRDALRVEGAVRVVHVSFQSLDFTRFVLHEPDGPPPSGPWSGFEGGLDVGVGWSRAERYPDSVVAERLHEVGARATLGDRLTDVRPTGSGRRTKVALEASTAHHTPLGYRVVAVAAGRLGLAPHHSDGEPAYALRGEGAVDELTLFGAGSGTGAIVRGLPGSGRSFGGNALGWASVALHGPLADPGRGLEVLPAYVRRLHWTVFCDAGHVFWPHGASELAEGTVLGAGGELRLDYEVGYHVAATLRLGAGHSFGDVNAFAYWLRLGL
ncbi:MAG: hypothetical protein EXR79_07800 [Myxococcales bacterium]|nr:hypothetical protein [Myxococcales bacterium]